MSVYGGGVCLFGGMSVFYEVGWMCVCVCGGVVLFVCEV